MNEQNRIIELHDSVVESISQLSQIVTVVFSAAYIHKSDGKPGIDPGTGWIQAAQLTFECGEMKGEPPAFPYAIWDGCLRSASWSDENSIPVPLNLAGAAELELNFDVIHKVQIRGKSIALSLVGEARFVENFPGRFTES